MTPVTLGKDGGHYSCHPVKCETAKGPSAVRGFAFQLCEGGGDVSKQPPGPEPPEANEGKEVLI